jgi:hypothetical protein
MPEFETQFLMLIWVTILLEEETANFIFYNQNTSKILGMNYIFTPHILAELVIILHR